ncbi:MAG TPA: hypothetical protein VKS99_08015 [Blastocatellia bacterium]|nr:hypothetical protein [Blastocatellia bacterium]
MGQIEPWGSPGVTGKGNNHLCPATLAYARAQIENTVLDVGAIGPAAEEIEIQLRQLRQLRPESDLPDRINLGLKAWGEYFQRRFQSNE